MYVYFYVGNDGTGGPCPVAHYCPNGTSVPIECEQGTFNNIEQQSECFPCPEKYYCPQGISNYNPYRCPAGYYCPEGECIGKLLLNFRIAASLWMHRGYQWGGVEGFSKYLVQNLSVFWTDLDYLWNLELDCMNRVNKELLWNVFQALSMQPSMLVQKEPINQTSCRRVSMIA